MIIIYKDGDLLTSDCEIIAHQTNCLGVMGAGIAFQIRKKWPEVNKAYVALCKSVPSPEELLGAMQPCPTLDTESKIKYVANLFGQNGVSTSERATSYDGIYDALCNLKAFALQSGIKSIGFPYKMSCGLGGGDWTIIETMINRVFEDSDIYIEIWKYNGK